MAILEHIYISMKRKLPIPLFLLFSTISLAQFNPDAPWMVKMEKDKTVAKTANNEKKQEIHSFYAISDAFYEYWKDKDKNAKGSGYKPFMRWQNYWKEMVDAEGNLPTAAEIYQSWKNKVNSQMAPNPTASWTPIGPTKADILNGNALPGTGRINAIAVDPNNADIWYAGAPAGGIWKSVDAGLSWTNLFDDYPQIGVSGIAIDPNDSNIIYIATGDDDANDSYSIGVFKSLDGGQTWNETGLNPSNQNEFDSLNEITIDPTNSNIVWVGSNDGLQKSINGGDTWTRVRSGNIKDFKLKPGDPNTIYAVSTNAFYRSTDGGDNFTQIASGLPTSSSRLVLGVSPADPTVVYVFSALGADYEYQGIYKSTDSGETFVETSNTSDLMDGAEQAWFDMALEVSPTNANELYTGVLNIWKSSNGGNSFTRLNEWSVNNQAYSHADIHTLKFFGNTLFAGTDGGIYTSDNGGTSFVDKTANMSISQFYRISVAKNTASKIAGGTQDNAGFVFNNGNWGGYTGGDGMDYEIDPTNANIIYGFSQYGSPLWITTNSGENISVVSSPTNDEGNWITPLAVSSEGEVYAGFKAVYKLVGNNWERLSQNISTNTQDKEIEDMEIDKNNPLLIYLSEGDDLFKSEDGGATFSSIHSFPSMISDIAINSNDGNIIYVTTSNRVGSAMFNQPNQRAVHKLTLNGNSIVSNENITYNLPTDQAYYCIVHQGRNVNNPIYVGTNLGVYRLDDTLTEWEEYFTALPNTSVGDLDINLEDNIIIAGTYGRGVWQSPIPVTLPNDDVAVKAISPDLNSIPCGQVAPEVTIENAGLNPITQVTFTYTVNQGSTNNYIWDGTLNSGESTIVQLPHLSSSLSGEVTLTLNATIVNDTFSDNNGINTRFTTNQYGIPTQLFDFENEGTTLIAFNDIADGSAWERGVPTGSVLNTASSGTQVMGTNLDGNHPDATKSFIVSKCYELSSITAPVLKFNMAYSLEPYYDIVYVEYSKDEGSTWQVLGELGSQPNWYNSDRTNASSGAANDCQNCPGAQWLNSPADYDQNGDHINPPQLTEYAYDFAANAARGETDLTQEAKIIFRIVFHSDASVNQEGVIIDDFVVEGTQIDDDDDDNDGILDVDDNCQFIANADQLDTDSDGQGDVCDTDDDNDGILDIDDNCPLIANADQADSDNDGIGDVCDDDNDNDGVPNDLDLCTDTPLDAIVDTDGCTIFSLPSTNFTIKTTGESCMTNDNGSIEIRTENPLPYTATLTDSENNATALEFTDSTNFNDLASGDYVLCITVASEASYERCFDLNVSEPEPLTVGSKVSTLSNEVSLQLSGGSLYTIELNGKTYQTSKDQITLPLKQVENILLVKTGVNCQGTYQERIVLSPEVFVYPNPVYDGEVNIYLGSPEIQQAEISLFNLDGTEILYKPIPADNGYIQMNISGFPQGIYILNVKTDASLLNYKIIKK